jgi:PAS domain S-box-containing protein
VLQWFGTNTDVTERKIAEKERERLLDQILQEKDRLNALISSITDEIWFADAQKNFTLVNPSGFREFDISFDEDTAVEELAASLEVYRSDGSVRPVDEAPPLRALHGEIVNNLEEIVRVPISGELRYRQVNAATVCDKDGNVIGSVSVVRDITELKKVEEALSLKEKEFRTLVENSPDIIARFDRQNRHLYINPAAVEPYGCGQEDIIGKTLDELGIDPEIAKLCERHYENVFATSKPEIMEFQHTSPQGKKYYFNSRIIPEFINGKVTSVLAISRDKKLVPEFADDEVTSVLAISRDITDIKEAEAKLKGLLDNLEEKVKERTTELVAAYASLKETETGLSEAQRIAHLGNWDWNIITNKLYLSNEVYRIYGCEPQELSINRNAFLSYIHPDDRDYVDNSFNRALNEKPINIEYRIILANGEARVVHAQGEVIYNEENIPVRTRGTIQDITERKKAEKH